MSKKKINKTSCHTNRDGVAIYYEDGRRTFARYEEGFGDQVYAKKFQGERVDFERDKYTPEQNKHYRLAVYGLGAIPREELKQMKEPELRAARRTFLRAQAELNKMKNEILDRIFEKFIPALFKPKEMRNSEGASVPNVSKVLSERCPDSYDEPNTLDFSFLGISKDDIIYRLTSRGILNPAVFELG